MYTMFQKGPRDFYLGVESMVFDESNKRFLPMWRASPPELLSTVNEALEHADKTDRNLALSSKRRHPFYAIMAERLAFATKFVTTLKHLRTLLEKGDASRSIEMVASIACLEGVCYTIDHAINNMDDFCPELD
jgi:hypothetical protein